MTKSTPSGRNARTSGRATPKGTPPAATGRRPELDTTAQAGADAAAGARGGRPPRRTGPASGQPAGPVRRPTGRRGDR